MLYYLISIEQTHSNGALVEYAGAKQYPTEKQAKTAFYDKCKGVNADLSDSGHTFMSIRVENSVGGIVKQDVLGAYQVEEETPEEETPEETTEE